MKTLKRIQKEDKQPLLERLFFPSSAQKIIPITRVWEDGIFLLEKNKYACTYQIKDINYEGMSHEDKKLIFMKYLGILNWVAGMDVRCKITIFNHKRNMAEFESKSLFPLKQDELDPYRSDFNQILKDYALQENGIVQDKFLTLTIVRKSIEQAREAFQQLLPEMTSQFLQIKSGVTPLNALEKLQKLYSFFHTGKEEEFKLDLQAESKKGHDVRDYICPDSAVFHPDHFEIGSKVGRALYLRNYANYIKDKLFQEFCSLPQAMCTSIDFVPIPTDEAIKEAESRQMAVETNIENRNDKQVRRQNFVSGIPFQMQRQKDEADEFYSSIADRDQRMMEAVITSVHLADDLQQLNNDTEKLLAVGTKYMCQFGALRYQQYEGLNAALPYGLISIKAWRTLLTEGLGVFMPFRAAEISHTGGNWMGRNQITKNNIYVNRSYLKNGNGVVLGVPGAGKSLFEKLEILQNILNDPAADVIFVDPENEYTPLVTGCGGEVIHISSSSPTHINAMDLNANYGDENITPLNAKIEFILSLCEQMIGTQALDSAKKSLIGRCCGLVYADYIKRNYTGQPPTLPDLYYTLLQQPEEEAQKIALELELLAIGSLNTFSKQSNVDVQNRIICYDIKELGSQLYNVGMLVVLDSILNRISRNRIGGKRTYIVIDELHVLFSQEQSGSVTNSLWKRVRKYGGMCTGLTQNVSELLQSKHARTLIANSELIVMLSQSSDDQEILSDLLDISSEQMAYVDNAEPGCGLLKVEKAIVPFDCTIPKNTLLYQTITTKFEDNNTDYLKAEHHGNSRENTQQ